MIKVTVGNNVERTSVIVDENVTLKSVLEQVEFDYSRTSMNLDGTTLKAGDINKTFADFGITDSCYLLAVAKADNAAKVNVVGDAMVVTSGAKLEDIKSIAKYRPEALILKGGKDNKEEIFRVGVTKGAGSINQYGVSFGKESRGDEGFAQLTLLLPDGKDAKEYISDTYGRALLNLEKLEGTFPGVLEEIGAEKARIEAVITVAE